MYRSSNSVECIANSSIESSERRGASTLSAAFSNFFRTNRPISVTTLSHTLHSINGYNIQSTITHPTAANSLSACTLAYRARVIASSLLKQISIIAGRLSIAALGGSIIDQFQMVYRLCRQLNDQEGWLSTRQTGKKAPPPPGPNEGPSILKSRFLKLPSKATKSPARMPANSSEGMRVKKFSDLTGELISNALTSKKSKTHFFKTEVNHAW